VIGVLLTIALAGCYGTTEPATKVGPESATLNAQGTANNGPATTDFQYWMTAFPDEKLATPPRDWPAGASGPFSEKITKLHAGTAYSFRVCGADSGGAACAQTRTFTTSPAVQDSAAGSDTGIHGGLEVNAHAGPAGQNPSGYVYLRQQPTSDPGYEFEGFVSCLAVTNRKAAVGAIGHERQVNPSTAWTAATMLVTIVDNDGAPDTVHSGTLFAAPTPNCATASFDNQQAGGDWVVNDATP
jgi:hypothetical protein